MRFILFTIVAICLTFSSAFAESPLKYGISSMLSASNTFIHYEELNSYIAEKLGITSEIIHKENYSDMNRLIENQQVDFASICTGAMLYLNEGSYQLVAAPEIDGKTTYSSLIIKNKNVQADLPEDLKGKTFAMTDRLSNTGFLFPTYYFSRNFSAPEQFFSKVFFTGTHDKSIYLVNKGVVDAAAVDNLVYDNLKSQSENNVRNIEIIHESPEFGIPPIVASKKMTSDEIKILRQILLNMHQDKQGKKILEELMIDRFTVPDISVYANVIKMRDYVENNK
ncbi:phosphonate ABC transporter, periplasmic phosphonate-binding protein [Denitrovibrio acetiphilus DSM 12809]|jgi:phosphonate transport system substrate-binding protein|uniref:Phosphonate ABC transporter, periplasmic phosphonate-binding protein n=1 Tax=Denitrovibrio acetiphilus (strain DSM 12809 / NBRC 114555 / N2460) TaxID=522772 RepID=D4H289_DENA2|nr:phosphate/phosphite/phosphonate ABC transporter substrate-binding protein [Denitrovibrio acetiphilus]ADD68880.1 phosphonate ABC transporter, periplasmic phosphonate-binding protein [Denitrovibrio acetiphilus DSM 12809]